MRGEKPWLHLRFTSAASRTSRRASLSRPGSYSRVRKATFGAGEEEGCLARAVLAIEVHVRCVEEGLEEGGVAPLHRQVEEGEALGGAGVGGGALHQHPRHRGAVPGTARRYHTRLHPHHRQSTQSETQLEDPKKVYEAGTLQCGDWVMISRPRRWSRCWGSKDIHKDTQLLDPGYQIKTWCSVSF